MEYNELLSIAQRNSEQQSALLKRKNFQNGRANGPDPIAVAAFKARKEREERERLLRAKQEKNRLLALRAQNSKSMKKAQMMKSRTKDNDFSRIVQTDDDRRLEEKIREKAIKDTKERIKARIDLEQKLNGLSRKEKKRIIAKMEHEEPIKVASKSSKIQDIIKQSMLNKQNKSSKAKPRPPPPPSYDELLNMASEKSQKKVSLEEEIKAELEFNQTTKIRRAMTQKEKDRYREEQYYKSRSDKVTLKSQTPVSTVQEKLEKKKSNSSSIKPEPEQKNRILQSKSSMVSREPSNSLAKQQTKNHKISNSINLNSNSIQSKNSFNSSSMYQSKNHQILQTSYISSNPNYNGSFNSNKKLNAKPQKSSVITSPMSSSIQSLKLNPQDPLRPPKQARILPKPRPKLPPIGATYRRGIYRDYDQYQQNEDDYDDEEMDEDDDMADFIDDGPLQHESEEEEYSKHIREIFGYDKRKYRNIVDDDIEVASYGQVMKEEMRSLREGIREDLEDIKFEKQEKRLKLLQKKAKLKGLKGY